MTTPSGDSVRAEIAQNALATGNPVKDTSLLQTILSKGLYADSNGNLSTVSPFPLTVTAAEGTTVAVLSITGASTASATGPMTNTIVAAAQMTTFSASGFARILITDSAGNVTNSNYYIQFGTIS